MYATNLGELQSIIISAQRCLACSNPRCIKLCPEQVDVPKAMRLIVNRTGKRNAAWMQNEAQAIQSVVNAIKDSFE
jgi:NADPH-dependent glutamate synthase beta subunit-like oxidoreductase